MSCPDPSRTDREQIDELWRQVRDLRDLVEELREELDQMQEHDVLIEQFSSVRPPDAVCH